jgi:signal peptidase I
VVNPVHSAASEDDPDRISESESVPESETTESMDAADSAESSGGAVGAHRRKKKPRSFWKELPILIGVALLLTFLIQQFLARVYVIPSESMEQTLHGCAGCFGDRVLVDKLTYDFGDPEPGDVIVFKGPDTWTENDFTAPRSDNFLVRGLQAVGAVIGLAPPDERDFVKRVIAGPGQTVKCCDANNHVLVDGKPLDEPYVYWNGGPPIQEPFPEVKVPAGTVWVMGDNRNDSSDSRYQGRVSDTQGNVNGVVPIDHVIGKARLIVLPPSRWSTVDAQNPQVQAASAMGAPGWQQGAPLGAGFALAFPVVWAGRRTKRYVVAKWPHRRRDEG